ncbi:LamG-like jellyroll fold domain-containing protein [Nannocystaceae bacterium ST9]
MPAPQLIQPSLSGRVPPGVVIQPATPGFVLEVETLPIIDTQIPLQGPIANVGGSFTASERGLTRAPIDIAEPEFGQAKVALVWAANSGMTIPSDPRTQAMKRFAIEMLIAPGQVVGDADRLLCSQSTPCSLGLEAGSVAGKLSLVGNVHVRHSPKAQAETGWVSVRANDALRVGEWTRVGTIWDGDCMALVVDGKVVARRVLRDAELVELPDIHSTDFFIGTWVDGQRNRYVGKLAGLRIWNTLPGKWIAALAEAENAGLGAIESRYEDLGGPGGPLGAATAPVETLAGGRVQMFAAGAIAWSPEGGARVIPAPLHGLYVTARVRSGLGFPIADEAQQADARVVLFEKGAMFNSAVAARAAVWGPTYLRYLSAAKLLGRPTSAVPFGTADNPDLTTQFERGRIYYSPRTGAFEVHGLIHEHYLSLGGASRWLGMPLTDEQAIHDQAGAEIGRLGVFEGGTIYFCDRTGAHEVHGEILTAYRMLGGPAGELGFPITDELATANGIRYGAFERGVIVWRAGWASAKAVREYEVRVEKAYQSGGIDDGLGDSSGEFYGRVTVQANGQSIVERERVPASGYSGASLQIDKTWKVPIRHDTILSLKIEIWDHDEGSGDDYHGRIEQRYGIDTLWGTLNADPTLDGEVGIWADQPCTNKGDASPSLNSIRFNYAIRSAAQRVDRALFRQQAWWNFHNFKTPTLGWDLYPQAFSDVDMVTDWFEAVLNPFDKLFYELVFKGAASGGNCFGMSTEAFRALHGASLFPEHVYRFSQAQTARHINIKQASQYSATMLEWLVARLFSLDLLQPTDTFATAKTEIDRNGACIMSMLNLSNGSGHAVLAYRYELGGPNNRLGCLYVADPNKPWGPEAVGDPSFIEVFRDNSFRAATITTNNNPQGWSSSPIDLGLFTLPTTLLLAVPYQVVASVPRTPFWEILSTLLAIGGLCFASGDASTEQVRVGGSELYVGPQRGIKRGHPFVPVGTFDAQDPPLVLASRTRIAGLLEFDLRGRKQGRYRQAALLGPAGFALDNSIEAQGRDLVRVEEPSSAFPMLSLEIAGAAKQAKLDYFIARDPNNRPTRSFSLQLAQAKDDIARVGVEARGGALIVSPGGAPKPFDLEISIVERGELRKGVLRGVMPTSGNEALRIVPDEWANPKGDFAVERLSSLAGGVLDRKRLRGT